MVTVDGWFSKKTDVFFKTEFRELTSCQPRKINVTFSKSYLAHVFHTQHETTQGTSCVACFFGILWIVNPLRLQLLFSGINLIFLQAMGIEVGENSWNLSLEGVPIGWECLILGSWVEPYYHMVLRRSDLTNKKWLRQKVDMYFRQVQFP